MHTIWVKVDVHTPVIKIVVDDLVTAQVIWEDLNARGYIMRSEFPE